MWVQKGEYSETQRKQMCRYGKQRTARRKSTLTLVKHGRVVVDIAECDVDSCGAGQPPQLAAHVLGLYDYSVVFSGLPVHIRQGDTDHT